MTPREAAQHYRRLIEKMGATQAEDALQTAFDGVGLLRARIPRGEDFRGQSFSDYTPDYAQRGRLDLGYQAAYKDYTRTGELLKSITAEVRQQTPGAVTIAIAPQGTENIDKVRGAVRKDGNLMKLSATEIDLLTDAYSAARGERVKKHFRT
jgi:rRNA maturation endonuclease Nob1